MADALCSDLWKRTAAAQGTAFETDDLFLELLGVTLPWSATVSYFLFLVLSLALQFILSYFAMNRVTLVYTAAYEALLAEFEEKKANLRSRVNVPVKSRSNPWNDQY